MELKLPFRSFHAVIFQQLLSAMQLVKCTSEFTIWGQIRKNSEVFILNMMG